MRFDFTEGSAATTDNSCVNLVVVSGTCCNPSLRAFDEQALRIIEQAAAAALVKVRVETMTLTSVYYAVPEEVRRNLVNDFGGGRNGLPVILIDGKAVSYGVPSVEDIKVALLHAVAQEPEGTDK